MILVIGVLERNQRAGVYEEARLFFFPYRYSSCFLDKSPSPLLPRGRRTKNGSLGSTLTSSSNILVTALRRPSRMLSFRFSNRSLKTLYSSSSREVCTTLAIALCTCPGQSHSNGVCMTHGA